MKSIKLISAITLLMIILVVLAGCNNDKDVKIDKNETKEVSINYEDSILEYKFNENDSTATVTGIKKSATSEEKENLKEVIIPSTVVKESKNYKVVTIGKRAFDNCTNMEEISLPEGITGIGEYAFNGCEKLEAITLPNSVTKIGNCVFHDCTNLKKVELSNGITSIPLSTFYKCTSLSNINLPSEITTIGSNAFMYCTSLTDIVIPDKVTKIDRDAFKYCTALKTATLPESLTEIGGYVFTECTSLTTITIPASVEKMGPLVFEGCKDLTINVKGKAEKPENGWYYDWNRLDSAGDASEIEIKTNWDETVPKEDTTSGKKTFEDKKVDKITSVDWKYTPIDFSNLKWLNTEKYGNICIPSNWEADNLVQALDENNVVYGLPDASQTIIIKDCSASEANSQIKLLLSNLAADTKLEEWSNETITMGDKNAAVVSAKFSGINHIQSTLFIGNDDKSRMIIVCVEGSDPDIRKLLETFTFDKLDKDAVSYFNETVK